MINSSCKVGIVIPSFHQHAFLRQAVQSVLDQTYANFKLIIVNDYAWKTDSEGVRLELDEVVHDFWDERVCLVHNEQNLWIAKSRNKAIQQWLDEKLKYIFFLDHDDIWLDPDKIKNQLHVLEKGEVWVLWTQFRVIDNVNATIWSSRHPILHTDIYKSLALSCPILLSSMWVNVEVFRSLGLLNERYNGSDDWEFLIRTLRKYQGGNLSDHATAYRCFGWNVSQEQWHTLVRQHIEILQLYWEWINGHHRSLAIEYMKLLIPSKFRPFFRNLKKYLIPNYAHFRIDEWKTALS